MTTIIDELRKKQEGFEAAMEAVKNIKPAIVSIEKKDNDENRITISYDPAGETFDIQIHHNSRRYDERFRDIHLPEGKLISEAFCDFFKEITNVH